MRDFKKKEVSENVKKSKTVNEMVSEDGAVWSLFVTDRGVLHISKKESE